MTVFLPVANLINLIIAHWYVSATVFAVFASLCIGVFKGAKYGVRAMEIVLALSILTLCARIVYYFINKDLEGLIKFGIAWLPTIIFLIIVISSTLVGIHRGLRKSLILLLHAVLMAGICLGLFFFCVTSPAVDKMLLDFVNVFMGEGGLQNQLGVSSGCTTMRAVLLEYVNDYVVDWGEFGLLLRANSAYIVTLINMAYRIVFAIVFFIIYQLLIFIMYLVYHMFYSERKYKRKRNMRFAMNEADSSYKKRPVGGGCVGLVRGLISGIISLSFVGSIFFVAVGGTGASKLPEDISFGENYEQLVSVYRSIEDYGEQGIFKILNSISDPADTPYYLFAADIVFSGGLDDELHDVSGNIKFREELAAYTGFAKNTLALLLKYDNEGDIASILRGEVTDGKMDKIINVCINPEFKVEFDNLIDNFDSQTYVINFALSLADAVIANIDDVSFMQSVSADNKELLQVMFRRGYLSDTIPDERARKSGASVTGADDIPPHLTVNHLFTKRDAKIVLDIVLSILANDIDVKQPATIARNLIPYIEDLSILSSERSREMDPVLARLYCYFDNKYLTDEGEDGITYAEVRDESVYWTKEIRALISVSDGIFTMYDKVQSSGNGILNTLVSLFDESAADYAENVKIFDELTEVVSDSALMSKVLCSKKVSRYLNEQLKSIDENIYFPENISYENKYDSDGNLIFRGEAYQLLHGMRLLLEKDNKEIIDTLLDQSVSFEDLLTKFAATITRDDPNAPGNSLASYLTESVLLRSALSSVIMKRAGGMLIVPALSLETDNNNRTVNLINKTELRQIFEALPELADLIIPLASEEINATDINNILESAAFKLLLDNGNKIVEGTISKALIDALADNSTIIISKKLENYEEWLTVGTPGELRKFLNTIDILSLDVESLMNGVGLNGGEIYEKLKALDSESIENLLDSGVFHYSASKMLEDGGFGFDGFEVIVPSSSCTVLFDDKLSRVIKTDELAAVLSDLKDFGLSADLNNENIIRKLVEQKDVISRSNIISASVVNYIVENENICSALSIPQLYIAAGAREKLYEYDTTNVWRSELPNMITAIDEIFGISNMGSDEAFAFNSETVSNKTNELLKTLNDGSLSRPGTYLTRLDVCYASDIIKNNITIELDKALDGVVDASVIASAKTNGYYTVSELRALSETAGIFDLDILNIDNGELTEKVKKEILTINNPRPGENRSTLDIMYPSAIIRYFITEELDKALNGSDKTDESLIDIEVRDSFKTSSQSVAYYPKNEISALVDALNALGIDDIDKVVSTDNFTAVANYRNNVDVICNSGIVRGIITKKIDNSLTDGVIDAVVKAQIKGTSKAYSAGEITALINALDELDMIDFTDFGSVNFSEKINSLKDASVNESGRTKLEVVYRSDIAVGVFTKTVKDTFAENEDLVYHPMADRSDLAVLKQQEIYSLVTLLGDISVDDFDVGSISISAVRSQLVPDVNGNPLSYLISANFTATLIKNTSLYVPSVVYKNELINAAEALRFTDALICMQGENSFNDWNVEGDMVLPDSSSRATILESEIMRATFSHYVFTNENNTEIVFAQTSVDTGSYRITKDGESPNRIAVICAAQLETLFEIIESCTDGNELNIPSFGNLDAIKNFSTSLDLLYKFDVTRYNMSNVIMEELGGYIPQDYVYDDDCYSFNADGIVSWSSVKAEALTYEGLSIIVSGGLPT